VIANHLFRNRPLKGLVAPEIVVGALSRIRLEEGASAGPDSRHPLLGWRRDMIFPSNRVRIMVATSR